MSRITPGLRWWRVAAVLPLVLIAGNSPAVEPLPRTVSSSRQFIVYCSESEARGRIASAVEQTKSGVLGLLGLADQWKLPIVLTIRMRQSGEGNVPASNVVPVVTDEGVRIQLDLVLDPHTQDIRLQDEVVRALLLELEYREENPLHPGTDFAAPPAWLVEGLAESIHVAEKGPYSNLFTALLQSRQVPRLKEFLRQDPSHMDSASKSIYRAYAMSLVQMLLDLPGGKASLNSYLRGLPATPSNDDVVNLAGRFPALAGSETSVEKQWILSIARISAASRHTAMGVAETEKELAQLLTLDLPPDRTGAVKRVPLSDFNQFIKLKQRSELMGAVQAKLLHLSTRAHPLYRPVLGEYQQVTSLLAKGRSKGMAQRLADLEQLRAKVLKRTDEIADYLNWFEATQVMTRSNAFDGYFKAVQEVEAAEIPRRDAITRYLDLLENEVR